MRALLAKLFSMLHKKEPQKPVEAWPFPPIAEEPKPKKECCGGCNKPAKKTVAKKTATKKPAVKKAKK